jgi:hypothetical protein
MNQMLPNHLKQPDQQQHRHQYLESITTSNIRQQSVVSTNHQHQVISSNQTSSKIVINIWNPSRPATNRQPTGTNINKNSVD